MNINQLIFIDGYLECEKFKTNNNDRSKLFLKDYQMDLESYLGIDDLFLFLLEISNDDELNFIYKFTYDYFFKSDTYRDEILEEVVYLEHKSEREATSSKLRKEVLEEANGKCFFECNNDMFVTNQNQIYLEVHHCIPLSYAKRIGVKGDFKENLIAVCPSCHRRIHFENDTSIFKYNMFKKMFTQVDSSSSKFYINSVDELYNIKPTTSN